MKTALIAMVTAFGGTLILTPLARRLAARLHMVAQPRPDRWAAKPTAKLGGAAIFIAVNLALIASGLAGRAWPIVIAAAAMFVVGLIDDLYALGPQAKIALQLAPALVVVKYGYVLPWTPSELWNAALTLLWLTGITNAINLLDNMDGLAAGIAAIGSVSLALTFIRNGQYPEAIVIATLFCALIAFLVYNFHPASIFMGDCGSLFIGFYIGSVALLAANVGGRSRTLLPVIIVPVLTLLIPIFDTAFVAFVRKLAGRSSMTGGRDHTSHRLVALGLHERTAVLLLYALALLTGLVALAARELPYDLGLALTGAVTIGIAILGFFLAGVKVYPSDELAEGEKRPLSSFLVNLSYRHRGFEVLLDVVLIAFAYFLAYRLHFGAPDGGADWQRFLDTLPIVVAVKVVVFLLSGMYGGMWRYVGVHDSLVYLKAVAGASIAAVLILLGVSRFEGLSRVAFVLDALILFLLVALTRGSFRVLGALLRSAGSEREEGVRTLIFGAGDGGELLLRELRSNEALARVPVAFFDDDAKKVGRSMHGIPVVGGNLVEVCASRNVAEVIVSTPHVPQRRLDELAAICRELDIPLRQMRITIAAITPLTRVIATESARDETAHELIHPAAPIVRE